ncbi:cupredoxin domain-containing protein [Jatrophihabitans fulvus]
MRLTARPAAALATAALALTLAACGSSDGDGGSPSSPSGGTSAPAPAGGAPKSAVTVDVKNFSFEPGSITVAKGGKVTWKFEDSTPHNVDIEKLKKTSPNLASGKTYSLTFNQDGTYDYLCTLHQYMTAKVIVK